MVERQARPNGKEIKDAYEYLFNSSVSLSKIKDAALGGRLFSASNETAAGVAGRSLAWKLFLVAGEPLQADAVATSPLQSLRVSRQEYKKLLLDSMRAPDGSYEDGLMIPGTDRTPARVQRSGGNLDRNNPLSLHDENPWNAWFASVDLRKTILQDVERTFPDIGYFRDSEVQNQLTNILFVYSVTHPDIGYRQGMHELLAPLYYAVDYDSISGDHSAIDDASIKEFCSRSWVAADAWALFTAVMRGTGRWYEWREPKQLAEKSPLASHVQLNVSSGDAVMKPYVSPIVQACTQIQSKLLKAVDPELWRQLQSSGIEPQIYGIRWLRLLFTREFNMHDAMLIWDGLFACDPTLDLAQWICVAMLIRIRNKLIPSDYSTQLTYLLRYPASSETDEDTTFSIHPAILLIRQALTLQMSPTPATGVSVIYENHNIFNIPLDVPDPPPPPTRRLSRPSSKAQSFSAPGSAAGSRIMTEPNGSKSHTRQGSGHIGLPEMIARGLLERGESLGINKTVMNAVTELKRNLPDLASSLARLPNSPDASYAAYPLTDERPPQERPPWEPRTRFEVERDILELRSLQRRLGDSVEWIVDTLLLDEGNGKEQEERVKAIQNRKREALECLAYVRDVLKGTVTPSEVEEERLLGEEELKRRRSKVEPEREAADISKLNKINTREVSLEERLRLATPQPAVMALTPNEPRLQTGRYKHSQDYFPPQSVPRSPPKSSPAIPPVPVMRQSAPASTSPPSMLTPNAGGMALAPWNHTRSAFSNMGPPIATLPRMPPRSSPALLPRLPPAYPSPSPQLPSESSSSHDQAPRRGVQHDPLGAIP